MNLKGMQTHQLLAALGACLAAMLVAGPAAARPFDEGGAGTTSALEAPAVTWYLTDEYRPFMLPESEANAIVNQRQLELAADKQHSVSWYLNDSHQPISLAGRESAGSGQIVNQRQLELAADKAGEQSQVIPYLSHGILEPEQAWDVVPYLSHGVLTESDAAALAAKSNVSGSGIPLSAGIPEPGELIVPGMPELGTFGEAAVASNSPTSLRDRPDGYQPQLGVSEFSVVADDGFDWQTTGLAASIMAALLVALAITFTRGNRHGYRSA